MKPRLPFSASFLLPKTGASRSWAPFAATSPARRFVLVGETVLESMTTAPLWRVDRMPSGPSKQAATASGSASMLKTTSAPRAAWAGLEATWAPALATSAALLRVRFQTRRAWHLGRREGAMPRPMRPVPTKPMLRPMMRSRENSLDSRHYDCRQSACQHFSGGAPLLIEKEVLRDKIGDVLRGWILDGELKPGERIVELTLSRKLNVSRAPLREALWQLARQALVHIRAHHRAYVTQLPGRDIPETFEIRELLETHAAKH